MTPDVAIERDPRAVGREAARRFSAIVNSAVAARGRATVALAGGSTPTILYETLAGNQAVGIDWSRVHLFWGDERCVPPDHAASNYALVVRTLLHHVAVPAGNVHRMLAEVSPVEEAARRYEDTLRDNFPSGGDEPSFDLTLLGVGTDGHTASLFPKHEALGERERWAIPVRGPADLEPRLRITLTYPLLNRSRHVVFMATGEGKRAVLAALLGPSAPDATHYPAAGIEARESVAWLVDREAAGEGLERPTD